MAREIGAGCTEITQVNFIFACIYHGRGLFGFVLSPTPVICAMEFIMTKRSYFFLGGFAVLTIALCCAAYQYDTNFIGRLVIKSSVDDITCATSTAQGSICASGAIESNGALDVAGNVTAGANINATGYITGLADVETITTTRTIVVPTDCGKVFQSATNQMGLSLPNITTASEGCCVSLRFTGTGSATGPEITFTPDASDYTTGTVMAVTAGGTVGHGMKLTKATAVKGDIIKLCSDGVSRWYIDGASNGVWADL
jgi:hypothetical protein